MGLFSEVENESPSKRPPFQGEEVAGFVFSRAGVEVVNGEFWRRIANTGLSRLSVKDRYRDVVLASDLIDGDPQMFAGDVNNAWRHIEAVFDTKLPPAACVIEPANDNSESSGGGAAGGHRKSGPIMDDLLVGAKAISKYVYGTEKFYRKFYNLKKSRFPFTVYGSRLAARKSEMDAYTSAGGCF